MFDQEELCVVAQTSGTEELCEAHVVSFFLGGWVGQLSFVFGASLVAEIKRKGKVE